MKDHQIIVNLKTEEFMQLQQLFKTSGARSLGAFVRQKVLDAVKNQIGGTGIGTGDIGTGGREPASIPSIDLTALTSNLKKLHQELKSLVSGATPAAVSDMDLLENHMNVVSKAVSSGALPAGDPLAELLGDLPLWTPEVKKDKPEEPALDDEFLSIPLSPPSPGSAASKLNKAKKISPDATPKLSPGAEDSSAGTQTPSSLPEKSDFSGNLPPKKRAS